MHGRNGFVDDVFVVVSGYAVSFKVFYVESHKYFFGTIKRVYGVYEEPEVLNAFDVYSVVFHGKLHVFIKQLIIHFLRWVI